MKHYDNISNQPDFSVADCFRQRVFFVLCLLLAAPLVHANTLTDISYSTLPGNAVQMTLSHSESVQEPMVFTIDNPARIVLDLGDTRNGLTSKSRKVGVGVINGYRSAEAKDRTRVVIDLVQMTSYETSVSGNTINIQLGGSAPNVADDAVSPVISTARVSPDSEVKSINFERGRRGEGLIKIILPSARTAVDMRQEADKLVVELIDTRLPQNLQRKLDVTDFATPVYQIDAVQKADNARLEIQVSDRNEHLAYQSNEEFVIEVKPLTAAQEEAAKKEQYTGEKLSLNFQDIEVRSVLQLLADFTGLNVVVSDTVSGNLTLRLRNVPWDQALDIILKAKGLSQRQVGNVIRIAPAAEIANAERLELEAAQQIRELEPLQIEYIEVNYADADDLVGILTSGGEDAGLLDDRGSIVTDSRTNTLIVRATASQAVEIRSLVAELDVPVKQVLIESRVVSANDNFTKSLGVRFGLSKSDIVNDGRTSYVVSGSQSGFLTPPGGAVGVVSDGGTEDPLLVDLPSTVSGASIVLGIGRIGSRLLQLELSAMQEEGRGEVISSPKLITADKHTATIQQGVQIPYQEATSSGATSTSFQDAVLSLEVTPQITPDDRVIMDLAVNRDSVGQQFGGGAPSINTENLATQVIVDNGETVVLGGVYARTVNESKRRVPFFSDLPYIGWAFRSNTSLDNKSELLIFVTPKILRESLQLN